ncbi:MAG: hypothetical protein DI604_28155 [Delftia acidovorans]|nr:MAG: hypothetical protein DI604_28155 [Delftia acidovorans]
MSRLTIGDTVRVKGIRSPGMVVIEQGVMDDDTLATCLWFDANNVARQISLRASMLEAIEPEQDGIPVMGWVT